jgi:thioesterase domain-containing protein
MVTLTSHGVGSPLFCVAPYGDSPAFIFRDLARELAFRHPCHGLRVPETPNFSYQAIAAQHIQEIKRVYPRGPYLIAGFSLGGLVAFELARQFSALGDRVPAIVLFETVCPVTQVDANTLEDTDLLTRILGTADPGLAWPEDVKSAPRNQRLEAMHAYAIARSKIAAQFPTVEDMKAFLWLWRRRASYKPCKFECPMLLFRTSDKSVLAAQFTLDWARTGEHERSLGWRLINPDGLAVLDAPGAHANFLFRPHASQVARQLSAWLQDHFTEIARAGGVSR